MHHVLKDDIVILSAARTPVGHFRGILADFDAVDLGAAAIGAALGGIDLGFAWVVEHILLR